MKSTFSRVIAWIMFTAVVVGMLAGCSSGVLPLTTSPTTTPVPVVKVSNQVSAEGHITPRDSAQQAFLTAGDVTEVLVKEGDTVAKDDVLVRLGNRESMEAAVAAAKLQLLNAQQAFDTLNEKAAVASAAAQLALAQAVTAHHKAKDHRDGMNYPRGTQVDIDNAWTEYQLALDNVTVAQDKYDRAQQLSDTNPMKTAAIYNLTGAQKARDQALAKYNWLTGKPTDEDLQTADAQLAVAKSNLDDAQREYDKVKNGPEPDKLALAQSQLENAKAQLAAAQAALDNLELKAPFNGTIVSLSIAPKEHVVPSQPVLLLADLSELYVDTSDLTEMDVVKLAVGQPATVVPDALPALKLKGHIHSISDSFTTKGGDILYTVRIRLDTIDPRLRWGMTVNATFGAQ